MLFVFTSDHIENVFLCLFNVCHGKLDHKFAHGSTEIRGRSNKIRLKCQYTSKAEIAEENNKTTSLKS